MYKCDWRNMCNQEDKLYLCCHYCSEKRCKYRCKDKLWECKYKTKIIEGKENKKRNGN